jgi:two-component sensor histidine kinase
LLAVLATAAAWVVQTSVDGVLHSETHYLPFVAAVLVSAIWGGWLSGLTAAFLGGVFANDPGVEVWTSLDASYVWALIRFLALSGFVVTVAEMLTSTLRREAALIERLTLVSRELEHRIGNVLAITQGLVRQTARSTTSIDVFERNISDRLQALASSQKLLLESGGKPISLRLLVEVVLAPFEVEGHLERPTTGPAVEVKAEVAVALSLLLNELSTNAIKYGSLSVPEGRLELGWIEHNHGIVIEWKELGGPHVTPPNKLGFGSKLLNTALRRTSGTVDLRYDPDGVRCIISLAMG